MNSSNTHNDMKASHWIKAAICAVIVLLLLFFVLTRSSCTQTGGGGQANVEESGEGASGEDSAKAGSESSDQDSTKDSDTEKNSESPNGGENEDIAESSENGENAESAKEPAVSQTSPTSPDTNSTTPDEGEPSTAGASGERSGGQNIGGLLVKGKRLGVILDVSGSMERYLESLRSEIQSRFDSPVFLEVEGCFIEPTTTNPPGSNYDSLNPRLRDSVMNAIRELVVVEKVDSIYWFCDLQDEQTDEGLDELAQLARGNSEKSPAFHLYIRSTDEKPNEKLDQIIRLTKGAFEKRR